MKITLTRLKRIANFKRNYALTGSMVFLIGSVTWLPKSQDHNNTKEIEINHFFSGLTQEKKARISQEWYFPHEAYDYAKMVEPELGVPPKIDLSQSIEIPLFVDGKRTYGNLGQKLDNPSRLGKETVSGSTLQRYEGRTVDGKPLPDVVWVSFSRNSTRDPNNVMGSVQMIGYNKKTGATAFFESSDKIHPWVTLDKQTLRMRGVMPWIDQPSEFNRAFVPPRPDRLQCVQCHQADPFITNSFINAAKMPNKDEAVVPVLGRDAPFYVIGGDNWDMRTIHIKENGCLSCHRVGMTTINMFASTGWDPNKHMPPQNPGSMTSDYKRLQDAWTKGPDGVTSFWLIPPMKGQPAQIVGDDYPHKASFNRPAVKKDD
jgi:hypothetical protein